jgi:hypothetical protein
MDFFKRLGGLKMQKQVNEELKEIESQQFISPKDQLGYAEEYIIIKDNNSDEKEILNYSLSNSLEEIKMAIFRRTGLNIKLEKAKWFINPYLSISVKDLMNKHHVLFSVTTFYDNETRMISINMRVGDIWFYTSYGELKGKCYSWDHLDTLEKLNRYINKYLSDEDEND